MIEVEMRGPLTKEQYQELKKFLQNQENSDHKITFKGKKERLMVCCTGIEELKTNPNAKDLRAKITNGKAELSLKKGNWAAEDQREEVSVYLKQDQFLNLLTAFRLLDHQRVIWAQRNSERYMIDEIELAIIEVPGHSIFFEVEIEVESKDQIEPARQKMINLCQKLNLSFYTDEEWYQTVEQLDKEANRFLNLENQEDISFIKEQLKAHQEKFS